MSSLPAGSFIGRFLLTGTEANLTAMVEKVYAFTNPIERRGNTLFCSALIDSENLGLLLAAARAHGVTVQQRDEEAKTAPYWTLLHQGELSPWKPLRRTVPVEVNVKKPGPS